MAHQSISQLISNYRQGYSLEQGFYKRSDVYETEIENIFLKHWILAGHVSQISAVGDYFLFELDKESVIITRTQGGEVKAHLNVCRHRGSRVCLEKKGNAKRFTCPYHAWSYGLDGALIAARMMDDSFDKSVNGLHQAHVELVGGLIFVSLAENPLSLKGMRSDLDLTFERFGFDKMCLAKQKRYEINANWKLAVENYQECYHCTPSHLEYAKIHALSLSPQKFAEYRKNYLARTTGDIRTDAANYYFDLAKSGEEGYQYDRHPLLPNMKSGGLGGKPVSILLGDLTSYEGATSEFMLGPVTFFLIYDDHMVGYRFLPLSVDKCVCDIFWFVNDDAEEGKDYELDDLTWLWDVTTQADEVIIANNQLGVDSRFYQPGKLSQMEDFQQHFLDWYVASLKHPFRTGF